MKIARLNKKEDAFWEETYLQLVIWRIHEAFTYDICFFLVKAKFKRIMEVEKLL